MIRVATITVSDTRSEATDESGRKLRDRLNAAKFAVTFSVIVRDHEVGGEFRRIVDDDSADVIISTGGTGISPRDLAYEAVDSLVEKRLDGFGEAFRRLSWDEIGPRAILSRAIAGVYRSTVIVALPGSPKAIALAVDQILVPVLPHAVALAKGLPHAH